MKLTIEEVLIINEKIKQDLSNIKLPIKVSYKLNMLKKKIKPILESFEEAKMEKVKQYGKEIENKPGEYSIEGENITLINNDLKELSLKEEELDLPTFTLEEFGDEIKIEENFFDIFEKLLIIE